ncbi:hypothetical protein FRB99_005112 [Tulasnella sp. 403]|nr:hypothetical protein FRB99_005112 [Tulasnella sp. 403]
MFSKERHRSVQAKLPAQLQLGAPRTPGLSPPLPPHGMPMASLDRAGMCRSLCASTHARGRINAPSPNTNMDFTHSSPSPSPNISARLSSRVPNHEELRPTIELGGHRQSADEHVQPPLQQPRAASRPSSRSPPLPGRPHTQHRKRVPWAACRCPNINTKHLRHWETACISNPNRIRFPCGVAGCRKSFARADGRKRHWKKYHRAQCPGSPTQIGVSARDDGEDELDDDEDDEDGFPVAEEDDEIDEL